MGPKPTIEAPDAELLTYKQQGTPRINTAALCNSFCDASAVVVDGTRCALPVCGVSPCVCCIQ
jgi:hypothetical protein